MVEIVPSKWMREYFKRVGWELSDFQKATMIWFVLPLRWRDRLSELQELCSKTDDIVLKKQIQERIAYEEAEFQKAIDNSNGRCIYTVEENSGPYGFFMDYDTAYKYLLKCIKVYQKYSVENFSITKQRIMPRRC